jgi:hypothetical protein
MSLSQFPELKPFIDWCYRTWLGTYVREESSAFPLIETIHLVALAVLLGSILMLNLRLIGLFRGWTPAQMARALRAYVAGSLAAILVTGVLLFLSDSTRYYANPAFGPKMVLLAAALLYHYTLYRKASSLRTEATPAWSKLAAMLSLLLWFGIGAAGRAIGFV